MSVTVHDPKLPNGKLTVDTDDPKAAAAAAQKYLANKDANPVVDFARSLPGGLVKGVSAIPGMFGDLMNPSETETVEGLGGEPITVNKGKQRGLPTTEQISNFVAAPVGGFYEPKTAAGRYGELAASFAPALLGGEASLAARLGQRVLAPAAAVQGAGAAVGDDSPKLKMAAQIAAALLAHKAVGGVRTAADAVMHPEAPALTAEKYLADKARELNVTPETIAQNTIPGRGQLGAETMGPYGPQMLGALARRSGTTAEELENTLVARSSQAPDRIMDDFAKSAGIHPEAARGNIDAVIDAGRAEAGTVFKKALASPNGVMTPELEALSKRKIIKTAMAQAAEDIRNEGGDPHAVGLMFDDAGNATQISHPTAEAWDKVKKAIGRQVERDAFGNRLPDSKSPGNTGISHTNRALGKAMGDAIPGYAEALEKSGDYLGMQGAFDAGTSHILDAKVTAAQVEKHLAGMTAAERNAYKGGIANKIFLNVQNARLAPRLLKTRAVRQKLDAALGPDKAGEFIAAIDSEMALAKSGGRMRPGTNSVTADALLASGDMDHAANLSAALQGMNAVTSAVKGNIPGAIMSGIGAVKHFAPDLLKTGGMNAEVRNELGKLLSLPPEEFQATIRRLQTQSPQTGDRLSRLLQNMGK